MKETVWEVGKLVLTKSGEIALLLVKTGAQWGAALAEKGAALAEKGAALAAKGAEWAARGLQSKPAQKLRPAMGIIMCVSAAIAVISAVCYFAGKKKES